LPGLTQVWQQIEAGASREEITQMIASAAFHLRVTEGGIPVESGRLR
jgi:hypothetical protein